MSWYLVNIEKYNLKQQSVIWTYTGKARYICLFAMIRVRKIFYFKEKIFDTTMYEYIIPEPAANEDEN
jgi:hypothetical protein